MRFPVSLALAAVLALVGMFALAPRPSGLALTSSATTASSRTPAVHVALGDPRASAVAGARKLTVVIRARHGGRYRLRASLGARGRKATTSLSRPRTVTLPRGRTRSIHLALRRSGAAMVSLCDRQVVRLVYRRAGARRPRATRRRLVPATACRVLDPPGKDLRFTPTASPPIGLHQKVTFGYRSHWLQPWRAWLDTPPATSLRDGVGMNFNVSAAAAPALAGLLARAGIRRARTEVGWGSMDYDSPDQLEAGAAVEVGDRLDAMRSAGIRPLVLLNASSGGPAPSRPLTVRLRTAAPAGARQILVDGATAADIVPGRTGIDRTRMLAGTLFTSVGPGGVVTLGAPLPAALSAGTHNGHILRYAPFASPLTANGARNPAFEETMSGWLTYVGGVMSFVRERMGDTHFDVEIWNELSNNSSFLSERNYRSDAPTPNGRIDQILPARTVEYLRAPGRRLSSIGITNGMASQSPFPAPSTSPDGLTALSKHPYSPLRTFPQASAMPDSIAPVDARGEPAFTATPAPRGGTYRRDTFVPSYSSLFPEYFLTSIQTESSTIDLSPAISKANGVPHGRDATTPGGDKLGIWLTEMGIDPAGGNLNALDGAGTTAVSRADAARIKAKSALRTYAAWMGKGAGAVYLYAAAGVPLNLVSDDFTQAAVRGRDLGDAGGGPVITAIRRFTGALQTAQPIKRTRALSLRQVANTTDATQFTGGGSDGTPPLYDRDIAAFFPFQLTSTSWAVPTYVMTRNVTRTYRRKGTDGSRYDLPDEVFQFKIGGVDGRRLRAALWDPLDGSAIPVLIVKRSARGATLRLLETDSPRMLLLADG